MLTVAEENTPFLFPDDKVEPSGIVSRKSHNDRSDKILHSDSSTRVRYTRPSSVRATECS